MNDAAGAMRDVDVEQIGRILDALDRSSLDFVRLEVGGIRLTAGRGAPPGAAPPTEAPTSVQAAPAPAATAAKPPPATPKPAPVAAMSDAAAVASPLGGLFYSRPEPGAPPFVQLGSVVEQGATLGLVEVMKVFNAVAAPVRGTVVEICVAETDLVAFGQTLFRIQPDNA